MDDAVCSLYGYIDLTISPEFGELYGRRLRHSRPGIYKNWPIQIEGSYEKRVLDEKSGIII